MKNETKEDRFLTNRKRRKTRLGMKYRDRSSIGEKSSKIRE